MQRMATTVPVPLHNEHAMSRAAATVIWGRREDAVTQRRSTVSRTGKGLHSVVLIALHFAARTRRNRLGRRRRKPQVLIRWGQVLGKRRCRREMACMGGWKPTCPKAANKGPCRRQDAPPRVGVLACARRVARGIARGLRVEIPLSLCGTGPMCQYYGRVRLDDTRQPAKELAGCLLVRVVRCVLRAACCALRAVCGSSTDPVVQGKARQGDCRCSVYAVLPYQLGLCAVDRRP